MEHEDIHSDVTLSDTTATSDNAQLNTSTGRPIWSPHLTRRQMLGALGTSGVIATGSFGTPAAFAAAQTVAEPQLQQVISAQARKNTLIGIGYETWFMPGAVKWNTAEATPTLGHYRSDDPAVIKQHAKWISDAGYDFILIDWSNNLDTNWTNGTAKAIIAGTDAVFKVYAQLQKHPKISLLIGLDANGQVATPNFNAQIAEIKSKYLNNPQYNAMLVRYKGKPLLEVYRGPNGNPVPTWDDPDFTVRYVTAFHESIGDANGQWSWIDRAPLISGPVTNVSNFASGSASVGENQNNAATPKLTVGHTVGQSFTFNGTSLTKVSALLATYGSSISGVTMTLYAGMPEGTLTKVASQVLTKMTDNTWYSLNVNPGQPAGQYYLEISDPVDAVVWWYYTGNVANVGGHQYYDRKAQSANQIMTFTASGTSSGDAFKGWQVGPGWSLVPNSTGPYTLQAPEGSFPSTQGSTKPGALISPAFTITGTFLSFYAAGIDKEDNSGKQNYFYLKDATTGQILRQAHTPGTGLYFTPIMWDVREFSGRKVVFVADNANAGTTGWMAFCNIIQTTAESSVAAVAVGAGSNPSLSGWAGWDDKPRLSGATLVWFMQQMFIYQPDVLLIQQWNEFGVPDQYNVENSNDIEPTVLKHRAGPESDGWGTYYLDLVGKIIRQYRAGDPFPAIQLDTRYP